MNNQLQTIIDDIGAQATDLQNRAANPKSNIWVNASAGTGKTKVLTDRVLRLLLPAETDSGTPPQNILCLTFTKAGANEMIVRVMRTLSNWAVCSESDLYESLEKLLGVRPSIQQSDQARQLFATIIDTPEGLNITTIHAFCQSLLGRFTIEAGLPANFKVMEEAETAQIIKQTRNGLILDCLNGHTDKDIRDAFHWLAGQKNTDQIAKIFGSLLNDRHKIQSFLSAHDDVSKTIYDALNVGVHDNEDTVFQAYFADDVFPKLKIEKLALAMDHGTDKNKAIAKKLNIFCGAPLHYRLQNIDEYQSIFLTQKNELASVKKITKNAREFDPTVDNIFIDEGKRILNYKDRLNSYLIAQSTLKLLTLARDIIARYETHKTNLQKLDYDDLIVKTHGLLSGPMRDWILFKMDHQIEHVLVDEAQDTSPNQWSIITEILNEFYSGSSARADDVDRTLFVVGDKKQSIFSFQGADPSVFANVQKAVETQIKNADKLFQNIPMDTSFRSTPAILSAVDATFKNDDAYTAHTSYRQGQSGRVELWPLYSAPEIEKPEPWTLPIEVKEDHNVLSTLADNIAMQIYEWIKNKEILKSKNRPIYAGDVMILVRRRNALVDHLIRALKKYNVPVSGADRLVVTNHIAVQDVLSVISFILMPDDDLALAEILKSPLVGWDDETLENIAYDRSGSLWNALKSSSHSDVIDYMQSFIARTSGQNAFTVMSEILNCKTPQNISGWKAIIGRLGMDAIDPLEELLSMAQNFDANNPATGLQGFIHMTQSNKSDIKRELEGAGDMVRIMTVHASKGLESPIVILPDTLSIPKSSGQSDDGLQWIDGNIPLWTTASDIQNDLLSKHRSDLGQKNLDEYNRLLYVAMTRAQDRLIVCGALNKNQKQAPENSWYTSIDNGFTSLDFKEIHDVKIYATSQDIDVKVKGEVIKKSNNVALPEWILNPIKPEQNPPKILKPSQDDSALMPVRSPLIQMDDTYRFRRGNLTHSLLQYLPDISAMERGNAATEYLQKQASDISKDVKDSILSEVMAILNDPQFNPYFGEGSLAEVPVTGVVDDMIISGQIDRMLITDSDIWIVDFKSNRPPPRDPNKIPAQYRKQLKAYESLIADMYPHHNIHCALLWTDGPFMMIIE